MKISKNLLSYILIVLSLQVPLTVLLSSNLYGNLVYETKNFWRLSGTWTRLNMLQEIRNEFGAEEKKIVGEASLTEIQNGKAAVMKEMKGVVSDIDFYENFVRYRGLIAVLITQLCMIPLLYHLFMVAERTPWKFIVSIIIPGAVVFLVDMFPALLIKLGKKNRPEELDKA